MKNIFTIISLCIIQFAYCQKINVLPKDQDGKVHFTKIIASNDLSQEQTYNKTKLFFINNFNSGKDVIQLDDKENSIIIGKGNTTINIQSGKYTVPVAMSFTIKIESKNNKCKVDIYNLVYNNESAAESFFNEDSENRYNKSNTQTKTIMENYRDQTLDKIAFIESKIKEEFLKKEQSW